MRRHACTGDQVSALSAIDEAFASITAARERKFHNDGRVHGAPETVAIKPSGRAQGGKRLRASETQLSAPPKK
eukprot:365522-Chlamydomonas_euryale.AAC.3